MKYSNPKLRVKFFKKSRVVGALDNPVYPHSEGNIFFTTDTGELFVDFEDRRAAVLGQILDSGLKVPIFLDDEANLPTDLTDIDVGTYWFIENMSITTGKTVQK